jgi:hypothetical protein
MKFCLASFFLSPLAAIAASTNALPALAPAYGEMSPTFWEQDGSAVIIASSALAILAILFVWKFLRPKPVPILPPEIVAREALVKLQRQPEDGKLLSDVSQILRRYVVAVLQFPSGELTTAEFCAAIIINQRLGAELARTVSGFLRECDVRKFSPANSVQPLDAATRALELIQQIEIQREKLK